MHADFIVIIEQFTSTSRRLTTIENILIELIHVCDKFEGIDARLNQISHQITNASHHETGALKHMSIAMDNLTREVAENRALGTRTIALLADLAGQIRDAAGDPEALQALADDLDAQQVALTAALDGAGTTGPGGPGGPGPESVATPLTSGRLFTKMLANGVTVPSGQQSALRDAMVAANLSGYPSDVTARDALFAAMEASGQPLTDGEKAAYRLAADQLGTKGYSVVTTTSDALYAQMLANASAATIEQQKALRVAMETGGFKFYPSDPASRDTLFAAMEAAGQPVTDAQKAAYTLAAGQLDKSIPLTGSAARRAAAARFPVR